MFTNYQGEIFALLTSVCWTISAMSYEVAGKRIGTIPMSFIRMVIALVFITIYTTIVRGFPFPTDADSHQWKWLLLSGFVGFVVGDIMLFQSFVLIGARVAMIVMALVPPITAFLGSIILGETMTLWHLFAMSITIIGIVLVMLKKKKQNGKSEKIKSGKMSVILLGTLLALGGAFGQSAGLVLSKKGMNGYDAFAASQIRAIAGVIGFIIIITFTGLWEKTFTGLKDKIAMKAVTLGSFVGPFIGVSFSLIAVKYTSTGIAATLTSLAPVIIVFPALFIYKEKISAQEVIGALIAVSGVALFFM